MKTLIKCDLWIQIVILAASLIAAMTSMEYGFVGFYFGLGGWQVIMAVAHLFTPWDRQTKGRKRYQVTLLSVVLLNAFTLLLARDLYFCILYAMLVAGPIMAFWNMAISYNEGEKQRKPHTVWDIA